MEAKALFVTNSDEVNDAIDLRNSLSMPVDIPKEKFEKFDLLFNI